MATLLTRLPAVGTKVSSTNLSGKLHWEWYMDKHPLYSHETQFFIYTSLNVTGINLPKLLRMISALRNTSSGSQPSALLVNVLSQTNTKRSVISV